MLRVERAAPPVVDTAAYGEVPALGARRRYDEETGGLTVFAVNRDPAAPLQLEVDLRAIAATGALAVVEHHSRRGRATCGDEHRGPPGPGRPAAGRAADGDGS